MALHIIREEMIMACMTVSCLVSCCFKLKRDDVSVMHG